MMAQNPEVQVESTITHLAVVVIQQGCPARFRPVRRAGRGTVPIHRSPPYTTSVWRPQCLSEHMSRAGQAQDILGMKSTEYLMQY